jgi:Cu-Zn family superoxide dismutase
MRRSFEAAVSVATMTCAAAFAYSESSRAAHSASAHSAICIFNPVPGQPDAGVRGVVRFTQVKTEAKVRIHVKVSGLPPNTTHGLHVHTLGNLVDGCISAGGHFNPSNSPHGGPTDAADARHAGDLGNVRADATGVVDVCLTDDLISLAGGARSIIGRSIVLHADEDDLGRGGHADSKTTGHAGARIACGVVGLDADADV